MQLHLMSWPEVADYLRQRQDILIPIGSTEQHGPMGLIGTDAICPEAIANAAAAELGCIVGPTINVGMAQHHLAFPGTIALRPSTLIAYLQDYVNSLALAGFTHFYFFNGHGGNIPSVEAAFSEIYAERSYQHQGPSGQIRCKLGNWFRLPEVAALASQLYGDKEGQHATPSEIALTQFVYPQAIKRADLAPLHAASRYATDSRDFRTLFPDGRMGADSALASPDAGEQFLRLGVQGLIREYSAFCAAILQEPSH